MRFIGLDVHKDFCEVALVECGACRSGPRVPSTPEDLEVFGQSLGSEDHLVLEATGGALAIARILDRYAGRVAMANPMAVRAIASAKAKTDRLDARTLAKLLAAGFLPSVWLGDERTRLLRRLVSRHAQLVRQRTRAKNQIHAVLQRTLKGRPPASDLFGKRGRAWLGDQDLPADERETVQASLRHVEFLDGELRLVDRTIAEQVLSWPEVRRIMTIPGMGATAAAGVMAAIGDIRRFPTPRHLVGYLGLDARVRQSAQARHGGISKQGSSEARHLLVEAAWAAIRTPGPLRAFGERIRARRGANIATVAVARKLAILCWHLLTREEDYAALSRPRAARPPLLSYHPVAMRDPAPDRPSTGVLETDPPAFTAEQAAEVALTVFGLRGDATELGSERDQNFLIDDGCGSRGVLKISNLGEQPTILDMETEAALRVARVDPELPVATPRLVPGSGGAAGAGAYRASVPSPRGSGSHLVRMFEHMPGRGSVDATELDQDALWDFGVVVARLGRGLRGFFHPSAGRVLQWDVQHAPGLRPLVASIGDPRRRRIVESVLDRFEAHVVPRWPGLRSQVIHGDVTLDNALVDRRGRVTGLVDFGDMSHTALLCDVSSALTSLLCGRDGEDVFRSSGAFVDGFETITPLEEGEQALIADLLAARLAATAAISAWRVARYPDNEYIRSWDTDTWLLLEMLDELGPAEAADRFGRGSRVAAAASVENLVSRRRVFGSALSVPTYDRPLHLVRGEGVWLFDAEGRRYLDAYNNVPVVGHCHPRVTEAIVRQARTLNTNMRYLHEAAVELAERLVATMPEGSGLDTVMLVNSGSEANDLAWRLATSMTGNAGGIVTDHAYHGVTAVISDLSPEEWRSGVRPSHVETIPPPDPYRGQHGGGSGWVERSAAEITRAGERLASRGMAPAAVFIDGGFTSDGILTPPPAYLQEVLTLTHEAGAILIADEVQVGHGRTGEHLWSFHGAGIAPDIVTLGKPMGNGHPVAAVITRSEMIDRFARTTEFFSTFGGNPVAAVAGLAVLDVIRVRGLIEHAAEMGGALREAFERLATRHEAIGDVRGRGLLIGVDLVTDRASRNPDPKLADRIVNRLRERGVLVGTTGPKGNVLKVRPPLVLGREHVDLLVSALDEALIESPSGR